MSAPNTITQANTAPAPVASAPVAAPSGPPSLSSLQDSQSRLPPLGAQAQEQAPTAATQTPAAATAPAATAASPTVTQEQVPDPGALAARNRELEAEVARLRAAQQRPASAPAPQEPAASTTGSDAAAQAAHRKRLVEDPHYAQAVGMFGEGVPVHMTESAREALEVRSQWQRLLDDPKHGVQARQEIARCDRELARVEYEVGQHRAQAAQAQPAATMSPADRIAVADRIADVLADASHPQHAEARDVFGHLTEDDLYGIATRTRGADPDAYWEALCAAAAKRKPAPAAQGQAPAATAAAAQPAPAAAAPQNGDLRVVRNPAPLSADKPELSATTNDYPSDRPPTLREVQARGSLRAAGHVP
jgi:hypothetical protein